MRLKATSKETKGGTALHNSHTGLFLAVKGWRGNKSQAWAEAFGQMH